MDIKIVNSNNEEVKTESIKEMKTPDAQVSSDHEFLPQQVAQLFDFKPSEATKYQNKIQTLIEYAKLKTEDHSPEGIKWAIRSLSLKVGTPPLGEKLINYLGKYAYLELETRKLEKEKEQYLKGGSL